MSSEENLTGRAAQHEAYRETADRCRALLRTHLSDPDLTVERAASALFVSTRGLQRALAHCDSPGFRTELSSLRAREAARLFIAEPALTVTEVAARVGYTHATHFSRGFRAHHGVSPSAYRQRARELRRRREEAFSPSFPAEMLAAS